MTLLIQPQTRNNADALQQPKEAQVQSVQSDHLQITAQRGKNWQLRRPSTRSMNTTTHTNHVKSLVHLNNKTHINSIIKYLKK